VQNIHIKELKSVRQALDKMLDTWEFRAILENEKALNPLRFKASEMAPPVGLEPTTLSVRNIVALLAWGASQRSLFLPAQSTASSAAGSAVLRAS
jgi:hypothetical protein